MNTRQRFFFALFPGPGVRQQLLKTIGAADICVDRPVSAENLHITLLFLGMVDEQVLNKLINNINGVCHPPFELHIDQARWWKKAGIAWLGPSAWPAALDRLVADIAAVGQTSGLGPPEHRFRPHITIGRRQRRPISTEFVSIPWKIRDFHLVESIPRAGAVEYKIIHTWALS